MMYAAYAIVTAVLLLVCWILRRRLNEKGVHMLDAPISGGSEGAANGTRVIIDFKLCKEILKK